MMLSRLKALGGFLLAATLSVPAWGTAKTAVPGTLNYIEGQASIGSEQLSSKSVGSTALQGGQILSTDNGRVEVLLTPGVFLRLDNNSAIKMVSPGLTQTEVDLQKGRALVEVTDIHKQNDIRVREADASTQMMKKGLYGFSADDDVIRVFKGQAKVRDGEKIVKVSGGHELALNSPNLKAASFNAKKSRDDFFAWSSLRSEYLAEANENAATMYVGNAWVGSGWYWDPWFSAYTFIPGTGILYSPFGWGFYSPAYIGYAPFYYGGYWGYPHYYGYHYGNAWHPGVVPPHAVRPPIHIGVPHAVTPHVGVPHPGVSGFGGVRGGAPIAGFHGGFGGGFPGGAHR